MMFSRCGLLFVLLLSLMGCANDNTVYDVVVADLSEPVLRTGEAIPMVTVDHLKQYKDLESLDETSVNQAKDTTLSPYFHVQTEETGLDDFPLKDTSVDVMVSGVIADVNIQQVYKNEGESTIEAVYIFPMSTKAAVYGMKMTIGDREIVAEIQKKEEARQNYEQAKREGKSASLLEQKRPNVFQMNVANILPEDEIMVELQYTELLVPVEQTYEFVFPTVVGPRFSTLPDTPQNQSESWTANPYLQEAEVAPARVSINVDVRAPFPIRMVQSPSHEVAVEYSALDLAHATLSNVDQDKDFVLRYKLAGEEVASGLMIHRGEEENFFLAMIESPAAPSASDVLPREYIYIIDVSGSMRGFPLSVSKAIVGTMLTTMRSQDRFNILFFAGGSEMLSDTSLVVNDENIALAQQWLSSYHGGGGTQLLPAMKRALKLPQTEGVSRTIAVVTDGYVSVEQETFEVIRENLGAANLFAYGIGSGVNRHLIEGMSRVGRGESFVVDSRDDALVEGAKFANYILNPVLTDIDIQFKDVEVYDVTPIAQPDVFVSRPIVVYGKFRGEPKGEIEITGVTANGEYRQILDFQEADLEGDTSALMQLWARNQIYELDDLNNLHRSEKRVEQVTELGLQYNLMTNYTSFVAIDSLSRAGKGATLVKQPLVLPSGVGGAALQAHSATAQSLPTSNSFLFQQLGSHGQLSTSGFGGASIDSGAADLDAVLSGVKGSRADGKVASPHTNKKARPSIRGTATSQKTTILGELDEQIVRSVVRRRVSHLRYCYEVSLKEDSTLNGRVTVSFDIVAGRVQTVDIVDSNVGHDALEACLLKKIKRWRFPESESGTVTQSFVFNTPSESPER